jgi:hypothetical protein
MAERYTKKDAARCFQYLVRVTGNRVAKSYSDVGGWRLDCNPTYGGCNIEEISNPGGAVTLPLGYERMRPREFCQAVHYAARSIAALTKKAPIRRDLCKR